jgi:hypothetical protein
MTPKHREPASPPRVPTIPTLCQRCSTPEPAVTAAPPAPPRVRFPLANGPHLIEPDEHRIMYPVPIQRSPRLHPAGSHVVPPDATANRVQPCTSDTPHLLYPPAQAHSVIHATTGQAMNYCFLIEGSGCALWLRSMANDLGRLAQGAGSNRPAPDHITGTNTIFFILKTSVPKGRQVAYCKQEASIRPTKAETHRVRNCAGGDCLDFPGPTSTQTASLTTTKLLLNSTISTPGAKSCAFDINNFYYQTPMSRYEYMKIHISKIPDEIVQEYTLTSSHSPRPAAGFTWKFARACLVSNRLVELPMTA